MNTWIVPENQRIPTAKRYAPPDPRVHPVELIVLHYTVRPDNRPMRDRLAEWAVEQPQGGASTHCVTSRRPASEPTIQLAPLDCRTWHAGGSEWNERSGVNLFSIGLDFDNVGRLEKRGGVVVDAYGNTYKGPAPFEDAHGGLWEPYRVESVLEVARIVLMLVDMFPLIQNRPDRIVGHEQIRSIKQDPGRAFDQYWPAMRAVLNGVFPTGLTEV